jgi:hypothetical protein
MTPVQNLTTSDRRVDALIEWHELREMTAIIARTDRAAVPGASEMLDRLYRLDHQIYELRENADS